MRALTAIEYSIVLLLITDIEAGIADLTRTLGEDDPAVRDARAARDWLIGIRDTGMLVYTERPGEGEAETA